MSENYGHRKRLRSRFLKVGFSGFLDYEVIELLLTIGVPRKDCKPIAKELINKFGNVNGVINASDFDLKQIKGLGDTNIIGIKLAREILIYSNTEKLRTAHPDAISIYDLADLAVKEIGYSSKEVFKIYCLDTKGFITSSTVSIGSLNSSIVHPRELFKLAIENNASSIVVAHNHPSGDTSPSDEDIYTTRVIIEAGKILGIELDDHIIVSKNGYRKLSESGYF